CLGDILDEATRKELFTDTFCKLCGAVLQFESQRMSHYEGKKHAQKVRLYIQMHNEKEERQEHGKQKKVDCVNFQTDSSGVVDRNKYCNICNMIFTSPIVALSHYLGKVHAKKLKQLSGDQAQMSAQQTQPVSAEESSSSSNKSLELNDPKKYCKLCCAPFNNPLAAHQHYVGKKHRRNEARKKMMEEMGDKAAPAESSTNAVGVDQYVCPICNVTLSSVEMYQSHMQENKHQTKETKIVDLVKNSKTTYDSFQDELTDYIKVQKNRGLESKTLSRKTDEEVFQDKDIEGRSDPGEVLPSNFTNEQTQHSSLCSETHSPTKTGENSSACENALEPVPDCHCDVACCVDKKASEVATIREEGFGLSAAKSSDCHELLSAETALSTYRKEQKPLGKHVEESEYINVELKYKNKGTKKRRKENSEDSGKESEQPKRVKVDVNLINEKRSRSYKDKKREKLAERESKKHKKDKKKPQTEGKTEEELLWDESILGY
ncbi:ZMAT1 protein, partial [Eudromia elegans]|nr:ZMAT1 protein [Eudromia elegans]